MKHIILICFVTITGMALASDVFNEYGVWHAVESTTLTAGQRTSAGPIDLTRNEKQLSFFIYGVATDSLYLKLDVYGMTTYLKADTVKAEKISTISQYTADSTIVLVDEALDSEAFPFLFIQLSNIHPDSSAVVDLWGYTRPLQKR